MAVVDPSLLIANCGLSDKTVREDGQAGGPQKRGAGEGSMGREQLLARAHLACCLPRLLTGRAACRPPPAPFQVNALEARGITSLFPIQKTVFEPAMAGHDLIARAKTGSGAPRRVLACVAACLAAPNHQLAAAGLQLLWSLLHVQAQGVQRSTALLASTPGCRQDAGVRPPRD